MGFYALSSDRTPSHYGAHRSVVGLLLAMIAAGVSVALGERRRAHFWYTSDEEAELGILIFGYHFGDIALGNH